MRELRHALFDITGQFAEIIYVGSHDGVSELMRQHPIQAARVRRISLAVEIICLDRFIILHVNLQQERSRLAARDFISMTALSKEGAAVDELNRNLLDGGGTRVVETVIAPVGLGNKIERAAQPPTVEPANDRLLCVGELVLLGNVDGQAVDLKRRALGITRVAAFEHYRFICLDGGAACIEAGDRSRVLIVEIDTAIIFEEVISGLAIGNELIDKGVEIIEVRTGSDSSIDGIGSLERSFIERRHEAPNDFLLCRHFINLQIVIISIADKKILTRAVVCVKISANDIDWRRQCKNLLSLEKKFMISTIRVRLIGLRCSLLGAYSIGSA